TASRSSPRSSRGSAMTGRDGAAAAATRSPATVEGDAFRFARGAAAVGQSQLREIRGRAAQPGVISFAVGQPATELFPAADLAAANASLLPAHPECLR